MQSIWNSEGMVVREGLGENAKGDKTGVGLIKMHIYTYEIHK